MLLENDLGKISLNFTPLFTISKKCSKNFTIISQGGDDSFGVPFRFYV